MNHLLVIREHIKNAKDAVKKSKQLLGKSSKEDIRIGELLMPKNLTAHENNLIEMEKILHQKELKCLGIE